MDRFVAVAKYVLLASAVAFFALAVRHLWTAWTLGFDFADRNGFGHRALDDAGQGIFCLLVFANVRIFGRLGAGGGAKEPMRGLAREPESGAARARYPMLAIAVGLFGLALWHLWTAYSAGSDFADANSPWHQATDVALWGTVFLLIFSYLRWYGRLEARERRVARAE